MFLRERNQFFGNIIVLVLGEKAFPKQIQSFPWEHGYIILENTVHGFFMSTTMVLGE
jgi:hypothetical protein